MTQVLYSIVLVAHSYVRWVLLILLLVVGVRSCLAWLRGRAWLPADERLYGALIGVADLQLLLGLLLYVWLSPLSWLFFQNIAGSMKEPILRFYGLEHVVSMLAATVILHIWRNRAKGAPTDSLRHRRAWTSILAALIIIAATIPWPGRVYGRPLLRGTPIGLVVLGHPAPQPAAIGTAIVDAQRSGKRIE